MSRRRRREDAGEDVFVYFANTYLCPIPSGITSLRIDSCVKEIPSGAFSKQSRLINVEYEEGLEVIGEKAFSECTSLLKQQFPSTLVEIGKEAFSCCTRLESVGRLPSSLKVIRKKAFTRCSNLQDFEIPNDEICFESWVFWDCSSLSHFRLPQGMVTIPEGLFSGCSSLVDVNVPSSILEIGGHAFASCKRLTKIELPAGLKSIGAGSFDGVGIQQFHCPPTVESIGGIGAFRFCCHLESVILPPKLEVISQATFAHCTKLTDISIPQSVVRIEIAAFDTCKLTRLDLSGLKLTSIGEFAFSGCLHLRDISLPKTGLKRIEEFSFQNCHSLTHLWVPPTVEYIENGAFGGCTSLLSVEVPETLKQLVFVGRDYDRDGWNLTELCGYESLVNIYIPPSHQLDNVEEYGFMEEMKLREAEGNYPELVHKLKGRFNSLPLHRACYFQSYHSPQENITRIRSIVRAGPKACERVDFLGMSPFHILALSRKPWLNLIQELLSVSSVNILECRDVFGSTPLDYLCENHSATAGIVTKSLLLTIVEPRVSFLGLDCWREDVMSWMDCAQMADASSLADDVSYACERLAMFEWIEVLSLMEMSIWRMKVEEEQVTGSDARESCRISCRSDIILEHVIPFLE